MGAKKTTRITPDQLKKKKAREKEIPWAVTGDDGEVQEATLLFRAIGAKEYDDLLAAHPPTKQQKDKGLSFDVNTFAPALLSRVCVDPQMSEEEWEELWGSPDWNRGELTRLFMEASDICSSGSADIPLSDSALDMIQHFGQS